MKVKAFAAVFFLLMSLLGCRKIANVQTSISKNSPTAVKTAGISASTARSSLQTTKSAGTVEESEDSVISEDNQNEFPEDPGNQENNGPQENRIDLQGRTIVIGQAGGVAGSPSYEYNQEPAEGTPLIDVIAYKNHRDAEEKYNCKIVVLLEGKERNDNFVTSVLSGIHRYDVYMQNFSYFLPFAIVKKLIYPITDYLDFQDGGTWATPLRDLILYKGERYAIPRFYPTSGYLIAYNRSILSASGYNDSLYEYYKENTWTWEKMLEIALNTTKDMNGDGIVEQYGLFSPSSGVNQISVPLVYTNGGDFITFDGNNYVYALDKSTSIKPLNFVSDLFNYYRVITTNNTFWYNGAATMCCTPGNQALLNPTFDRGIMPFPRSSEVGNAVTTFSGCQCYAFVTTTPEADREGIVKAIGMRQAFWDPSRPDHISIKDWLYDSQIKAGNLKTPEDIEIYVNVMATAKISYLNAFSPFLDVVNSNVLTKIITREVSVTQAISAAAPLAQAAIDSSQN